MSFKLIVSFVYITKNPPAAEKITLGGFLVIYSFNSYSYNSNCKQLSTKIYYLLLTLDDLHNKM